MFDHILEQYLAQLTATGRSRATQRAVRSDLTQFCTWWEHTHQRAFDLTQVIERDLRAWKVARQQVDGAAPGHHQPWPVHPAPGLHLGGGSRCLQRTQPESDRHSFHAGLTSFAARSGSGCPVASGRSEPDLRLRLRDEALLALLVYAGLRVQEACDVQLRDLDLASGTLMVRSGKGGKARRLPLHSEAQRSLTCYLQEVRCPKGYLPSAVNRNGKRCLVGMQSYDCWASAGTWDQNARGSPAHC